MNDNAPSYPAEFMPLERGLTVQQVSEILGYSDATIRRMIKSRELEAYGRGKKMRIYESSIARYRRNTGQNLNQMPNLRQNIRVTGSRHQAAMKDISNLLR